jgi:cytochrome P450
MVQTTQRDLASLPLPPKNPLPYKQRIEAVRTFHTGIDKLRDAGGPVTRFSLGPRWLMPPVVLVTSPSAIRDVLSTKDDSVDKTTPVFVELRRILGSNLADLPYALWQPRRRTLQPVFTKQRVHEFGGHMALAAESVAEKWIDNEVDLDAESRMLTLAALGRSVLGMDLNDRGQEVSEPLREALQYAMSRALRPVRAPWWLPTPARRRARSASAQLHRLTAEILHACRADPGLEAPLVHALMAATDPLDGTKLSDDEICDELIIFLFAGHETTATTLAYALWQLGRNPQCQDRLAAEVGNLPARQLTPDDLGQLPYTVQVVREALRLCPPAPTGTRMASRDLQVGGYRVKAGTMLLIGRMAVHRDPTLWANPLDFDPERFDAANASTRDRWQYLPFGGGPRSCIGDHFAMMEASLGLATLVRQAEIRALADDFPVALHFSMIAGGPIRAHVRRRTTAAEPE